MSYHFSTEEEERKSHCNDSKIDNFYSEKDFLHAIKHFEF